MIIYRKEVQKEELRLFITERSGDMKTWQIASILVIALIIIVGGIVWIPSLMGNDESKDNDTETTGTEEKTAATELGASDPRQGDVPEVEYPTSNWMYHGGDMYSRRYSPLDSINLDTIDDLNGKWTASLGSGTEFKYSGEATPLVYEGIMYVTTGANDVIALDAVTGEEKWAYRAEIAEGLDTVCCGWNNRGVAIGNDMVFTTLLDARLVALDIKTGEVVWETVVAEWEEGYTITNAPLFYDGKVYTGVAGGEYGIRGRIMAYDANIGREVWRFYTIPAPGEPGSDTWPVDNDNWLTGGGPVWQTPAVDPELNMIYFAIGNTAPDLDGSNREGDNLFADSVIALDLDTGEYQWHFQEVHHDIWDLDPANPVVLYDVEMDGEMKKGIAQAGKTGFVYFLDRTNGEPLVGIEEQEVPQDDRQKTSPTQPIPKGDSFVPQEVTEEDVKRDLAPEFDGKIGGLFTPFWEEPVTLKPSPQGGANWPPSAYSPDTEYFYVMGNDNYFSMTRSEDEFSEGDEYMGSVWQPVSDAPQRGTVTALDVKTNKVAWQVDWDTIAYSGLLVTKGNLLFAGHNDGRLIAYDATTGDQVWEYQTDAGVNAPSISYEIDGVQYISVLAAGNSLAGSKHGDKVYTFTLDGKIDSGTIADKAPAEDDEAFDDKADGGKDPDTEKDSDADKDEDKDDETAQAETDAGLSIYESNCLSCHGDQGAGGHNGPNLQQSDAAEDLDTVINRVSKGKSIMPAFEEILTEEEIQEVAEYVNTIIAPMQ